jgi:hypothetical protein
VAEEEKGEVKMMDESVWGGEGFSAREGGVGDEETEAEGGGGGGGDHQLLTRKGAGEEESQFRIVDLERPTEKRERTRLGIVAVPSSRRALPKLPSPAPRGKRRGGKTSEERWWCDRRR